MIHARALSRRATAYNWRLTTALAGRHLKTELPVKHRKPVVYDTDLPEDILKHYLTKKVVAVDTETRGLQIARDRLCLIQLCDDDGVVSFVRFSGKPAPNLNELFLTPTVLKLFHFGRFDIAVLKHYMKVDVG